MSNKKTEEISSAPYDSIINYFFPIFPHVGLSSSRNCLKKDDLIVQNTQNEKG